MLLLLGMYIWAAATFYLTFEIVSSESMYTLDFKDKVFNASLSLIWPFWIVFFIFATLYFKFIKK